MTEQPTEKAGRPDVPRAIALMVLGGISAGLVWSFHNHELPGIAASLVVGGFFGCLSGGLVGVGLLPSLMTMAAMIGLIEGVSRGWQNYGWIGAAFGGLIGVVVAAVVGMLPVMMIHGILVFRGIDPFVDAKQDK